MSLLGVDIGTTGCKATAFSVEGEILGKAYQEYHFLYPQKGWMELDSQAVWDKIKMVISQVASQTAKDPIKAFSVSSFGEAVTPVSKDRRILGNCIIGFDDRGQEYIPQIEKKISLKRLFAINGNILGHIYTAPKLMWLKEHNPSLYNQTYKFLFWEDLVYYLLGCDAVIDYSLANRSLLFDIHSCDWSDELLNISSLDRAKFAKPIPSGTVIGTISNSIADELGLPKGVKAVTGGHDQCCTALGAGIIKEEVASYGIGTVICITPAFSKMPDLNIMRENNLNIEHHTVPGLFVSFLYNFTGGSALKWFRDTFGENEKVLAKKTGKDPYDILLNQIPEEPTNLLLLPHFAPTGPPLFESKTGGVLAGLTLNTTKGEILKAILEGVTYYFKEGMQCLEEAGIPIREFRPTGGGAKSKKWLQIKADIFGIPFVSLKVTEAGTLGTAILAGIAINEYASLNEAVERLVKTGEIIEPNLEKQKIYQEKFALYKKFFPKIKDLLYEIHQQKNQIFCRFRNPGH